MNIEKRIEILKLYKSIESSIDYKDKISIEWFKNILKLKNNEIRIDKMRRIWVKLILKGILQKFDSRNRSRFYLTDKEWLNLIKNFERKAKIKNLFG